jgi:polygalacturonase
VRLSAGNYLCYSIRLKSNVALQLEQGATIIAADPPSSGSGGYDLAEPKTPWDAYQDFGHNHWHNSLIWGEGLVDLSILGPGLIWGRTQQGLRRRPYRRESRRCQQSNRPEELPQRDSSRLFHSQGWTFRYPRNRGRQPQR